MIFRTNQCIHLAGALGDGDVGAGGGMTAAMHPVLVGLARQPRRGACNDEVRLSRQCSVVALGMCRFDHQQRQHGRGAGAVSVTSSTWHVCAPLSLFRIVQSAFQNPHQPAHASQRLAV